MLRTRLWMGALLIALTLGDVFLDESLAPWYPFLLLIVLGLSLAACFELRALLNVYQRLPAWLCFGGVAALVLTNWLAHAIPLPGKNPWFWIAAAFAGVVL